MALLLTETDVRAILTMPLAIELVEESFRRLADGAAILHPRQRLHLPGQSFLHYMAAGDNTSGYMGMKIYTTSREGARFLVPLIRAQSGEWLAFIEADYIGQMRTGAATRRCYALDGARRRPHGSNYRHRIASENAARGNLARSKARANSRLRPRSGTPRTFRKGDDGSSGDSSFRPFPQPKTPWRAPISWSLPQIRCNPCSMAAGSVLGCTSMRSVQTMRIRRT